MTLVWEEENGIWYMSVTIHSEWLDLTISYVWNKCGITWHHEGNGRWSISENGSDTILKIYVTNEL